MVRVRLAFSFSAGPIDLPSVTFEPMTSSCIRRANSRPGIEFVAGQCSGVVKRRISPCHSLMLPF